MTNKEKFERLDLVLAILRKLDLSATDVIMYHNALDLIQRASEEGMTPQRLGYCMQYDQAVIDLITEILDIKQGVV